MANTFTLTDVKHYNRKLNCNLLIPGLLAIHCFYKNNTPLPFKVPYVPFIPGLCIGLNLSLMTYLDLLTWARFGIWMTVGKFTRL